MRKLSLLFIALSFVITLLAQERTHMPYSVYGLGEIHPRGFGRNMAMGRSGIALASPRYLNNLNPASNYRIDSISFFFDLGLSGEFVKYRTIREGTQRGNDINLRNLAIGFRISRNWTSIIGISPYSTIGYKIETTKIIEGSPGEFFDLTITGNGGLNQFYWNNSYLLFKKLSLGVGFSYLFGNVESTESSSADFLATDILVKQSSYMHKLYADFGAQYFFPVKENFSITLGAVFGNSHKIKIKDMIIIDEADGTTSDVEVTRRGTFDFPVYVGGGLAISYKNSLTFTADYEYHDWSNTESDNENYAYTSNNIFRAGLEMFPGRYQKLGYFGSIAYRLGGYYEESYLDIQGNSIADRGITAGLGFPFLQNRTTINLSYNYGIKGTLDNHLIKENYHAIMFSLTMHDWWFIKRKID
jgi:hypothetical protein